MTTPSVQDEIVEYHRARFERMRIKSLAHTFVWQTPKVQGVRDGLDGRTTCGVFAPILDVQPTAQCPVCFPVQTVAVTKTTPVYLQREGSTALTRQMTYDQAQVILRAVNAGRHLRWPEGGNMLLREMTVVSAVTGESIRWTI